MSKARDALVEIAAQLAPKQAARIAKDIELAIARPKAYLAKHVKRMSDRSVDKPFRELPWLALIEGLHAAKRLREIDWKTSGVDLGWNLEALAPKAAVAWLRKVDEIHDERSTLELLEEAGQKLLAAHELQLAHLDMASDSFCLVVAAPDVIRRCAELAKASRLGTIERFTGKGLPAAQRERKARQARDEKAQKAEAKRAAKARDAWRFFVKGRAAWTLKAAPLAVDTGYEAPGEKFYRNHYYADRARCRAAAAQIITAWTKAGFREVDRATHEKVATSTEAYIGWTAAFPEGARYWLEAKKIVRCLYREGDAVVSLGGMLGQHFGQLQTYRHYTSPEVAEKQLATAIAQYDAVPAAYKPITREALAKRW